MKKRFPDFISVLDAAYTTISPDRSRVLSFDREGRMIGFFRSGLTYRRGLDSRVVLRWREERRRRRWLSTPEAFSVYCDVYALARRIYEGAEGELKQRLETEILPWTPRALLGEERRFRAVYQPIPILPPDQYRSIVLQVTEGCTWNKCTFCSFYQGTRFRMRSLSHFEKHTRAVHRFLGAGLRMRRGIFLGDGNALALKAEGLFEYIELIRKVFPDEPLYGFVDVFSGQRHTVEEWRALAELGLHRVYIGMETGYDPLLRFLNKPGSQAESIELVAELKEAGLAVSPIVMVGVGGQKYRNKHSEATLEALSQMSLGDDDMLYLSPFIEDPDSLYGKLREEAGIVPLDESAIEDEYQRMSLQTRSLGIKTSRYDIRDFLY